MSRELSPKLTATFSDPGRCAQHVPRRFSPRPAYASKITHVELRLRQWILRWRGQNQRLTLSKLRKMKPLLSAPIAAEADAQAHRASAGCALRRAACGTRMKLQLMLTVPPLEHLLDTGRVKSSGSGLWLEFGVATGQSIQMIARYGPVKQSGWSDKDRDWL